MSPVQSEQHKTSFTTSPRAWLGEWQLWLLLAAMVLYLSPWLLLGDTLFFRDLHLQYIATARLVHQLVDQGSLPLWDQLQHGGQPLLGNPNRFLLYPSRLLYLVLDPTTGLCWELGLHLLLAAAGAYLLARALERGRAGAMAAGLVTGLSGFSLSLTVHQGRLLAFAWMPLILLWAHLLAVDPDRRRRWFLLATVCAAVQWLSAGLEMILLTALLLVSWQLVLAGSWRQRLHRVARVLLSQAVALLLAAIQVLPAAAMVLRSSRSAGGVDALLWSVHPLRLLEVVLPGLLGPMGTANPPDTYWGQGLVDLGFPYMLSLYLGLVPLLLGLAGLRSRAAGALPVGLRRLLGLLWLAGTVLACGRYLPGLATLLSVVPGASLIRFPVKLLGISVVPAALLAAAGVDLLSTPGANRRDLGRLRLTLGLGAAMLSCLCLLLLLLPGLSTLVQRSLFAASSPEIAAGIAWSVGRAAAAVLVTALLIQYRWTAPRRWHAAAVVAVLGLDLALAGQAVLLHAPRSLLSAEPALVAKIRRELHGGRLYRAPDPPMAAGLLDEDSAAGLVRWRQRMLSSYLAAGYGIPMIFHDDDASLAQQRMVLLRGTLEQLPVRQRLPLLSAARVSLLILPQHLQVPGLEHLLLLSRASNPQYHLYRNRGVLPHAWFTSGSQLAADAIEALQMVCSERFDPAAAVVLEAGEQPPAPGSGSGDVTILDQGPDRSRCQIEATSNGFVVFSEPWSPGWQVLVDGHRQPLLHANLVFSAVAVGPGSHLVERRYRPLEVWLGALISLLMLIILMLTTVWPIRRWSARYHEP